MATMILLVLVLVPISLCSASATTASTFPLEFGTVNGLLDGITVEVPPMQLPPVDVYTMSQDDGTCSKLGILDTGLVSKDGNAVNVHLAGVSFACKFVVTVKKEVLGERPLIIYFGVNIETTTASADLDLNITSANNNDSIALDFGDCKVSAPRLAVSSRRLPGGSSLSFLEEWLLLFAAATFDEAVVTNVQPFLQNTFCNAYYSLDAMTVVKPQNSQAVAFDALAKSIAELQESSFDIPQMMIAASEYLDPRWIEQQQHHAAVREQPSATASASAASVTTTASDTTGGFDVETMNQLLREKTFDFRENESYNIATNIVNGLLGQPEGRPAINIAAKRLSAKLGRDDPDNLSMDPIINYLKPKMELGLDNDRVLKLEIKAATLYGMTTFTKYDILRPSPALNATLDFAFAMDRVGLDVSVDMAIVNKSDESVGTISARQTAPTPAPTHAPIGMLVLDSIPEGFNDTLTFSVRMKEMDLNASALLAIDPDTFSSLPLGGIFRTDIAELFTCVASATFVAAVSKFQLAGQFQQDTGGK
jgi:hypothetical protein